MRFAGRLTKEGKFWLAEVPLLDAMTQGRTRKEALDMVADLVETLANREGFKIEVHAEGRGDFEISASEPRYMTALMLRRQRETAGLSLAQAAERLGVKSRNAYARYERGNALPTLQKLSELIRAVAPGQDVVLRMSSTG